jgi:hypothetical protein
MLLNLWCKMRLSSSIQPHMTKRSSLSEARKWSCRSLTQKVHLLAQLAPSRSHNNPCAKWKNPFLFLLCSMRSEKMHGSTCLLFQMLCCCLQDLAIPPAGGGPGSLLAGCTVWAVWPWARIKTGSRLPNIPAPAIFASSNSGIRPGRPSVPRISTPATILRTVLFKY